MNNNAMGEYTPQTQFEFDESKLIYLGFNEIEINLLRMIIVNGGKVTVHAMTSSGLSYEEARRIKYMYDICTGRVIIDNLDDLVKHLRRLNANKRRIGISDLAVSRISRVPRKAVVSGINDLVFSMYNSERYKLKDRMYDVVNVTPTRVMVRTGRKPILKYKQPKYVDGVLEILEVGRDGSIIIAFDKKYVRLCNRFIIVGSLRRPEFHHGMIEIICVEGTRVYVYAQTLGVKELVKYNMGTQRIYDYGFFGEDIRFKLKAVGEYLYRQLCGVHADIHPANQDFRIITEDVGLRCDRDRDLIEIED